MKPVLNAFFYDFSIAYIMITVDFGVHTETFGLGVTVTTNILRVPSDFSVTTHRGLVLGIYRKQTTKLWSPYRH